MAAVVDSITSR